jgi:hypothetical protein
MCWKVQSRQTRKVGPFLLTGPDFARYFLLSIKIISTQVQSSNLVKVATFLCKKTEDWYIIPYISLLNFKVEEREKRKEALASGSKAGPRKIERERVFRRLLINVTLSKFKRRKKKEKKKAKK